MAFRKTLQTGGLGDWPTGGLDDWPTGRLADWPTGELANHRDLISVLAAGGAVVV
jgi:hypothetical protein